MTTLQTVARDTLRTGAIATAATTLAVAALGEAEDGHAIAPVNAVSHIAWGDKAARQTDASLKYTLTGALVNAAAIGSWAAIHSFLFARHRRPPSAAAALASGTAVSALAYVTDYHVVPDRLTPGFEKRLSGRSLFAVYTVLALGLAAGAMTRPRVT